jgi:hypothetical protein
VTVVLDSAGRCTKLLTSITIISHETKGGIAMMIQLKCFSTLSESQACDYTGSVEHDVPEGETVESLIERLGLPRDQVRVVLLNGKPADFNAELGDGDQLGLAPVTGGM